MDVLLPEMLNKCGILNTARAMAYPLRLKKAYRFPHILRSTRFACMSRSMQASVRA
jgi:hypothetical protein